MSTVGILLWAYADTCQTHSTAAHILLTDREHAGEQFCFAVEVCVPPHVGWLVGSRTDGASHHISPDSFSMAASQQHRIGYVRLPL